MSDPVTELLHSVADQAWPRLQAAEQVRRNAELRRRNRRAAGVVASAAVVAVALATGLAGHATLPVRPGPAVSPTPSSSVTRGADGPFLTKADWYQIAGGGHPGWNPTRAGEPQRDLTRCMTNPMTWEAASAEAAELVEPGVSVYHEYVLRYDTEAEAHQAVVDAWHMFDECMPKTVEMMEIASPVYGFPRTEMSELFFLQQDDRTAADQRGVVPGDRYVGRVARLGTIVVVLENVGDSNDRSEIIMWIALMRVVGRDADRSRLGESLVDPDVLNADPFGGRRGADA